MLAVESTEMEDDRRRELLLAAHRQMPEVPWVVCRLAEAEGRAGGEERAEALLRGLLERDPQSWELVRTKVRARCSLNC
jgi:succinate dehydrogenase flavin-adding protein (antitoxin of CptAB toxin-antitoxin module)